MKIACIGNAVYDVIVIGEEFIIEDERNSFNNATFAAGGPALVAASTIKKFGVDVDFYGRIGNDENGKFIINALKDDKINIKNLKVSNLVFTPFSFIIINSSKNSRTINSVRPPEDYKNPKIGFSNYGNDYDYILTDGKYPYDTLNLIKNNPKATTIIDAGRNNAGVLKLCEVVNYIICSEDFANKVTKIEIGDNLENKELVYLKLKELFPNAKGIAITVGKNGYIYEKDGFILSNKPYLTEKKVIDTNGAGDIFHGAFTYALSSGYDYYQSLKFANITASLSTTKIGGRNSCPNLEEVQNIFNKNHEGFVKKIKKRS